MGEQITIRSEIDKRNPLLCRFVVERTLFIGTKTISSKAEAQGFPLAEKLFEIGSFRTLFPVAAKIASFIWVSYLRYSIRYEDHVI